MGYTTMRVDLTPEEIQDLLDFVDDSRHCTDTEPSLVEKLSAALKPCPHASPDEFAEILHPAQFVGGFRFILPREFECRRCGQHTPWLPGDQF